MVDFAERDVIVTGGTGGLGTAVVQRLLAAGAHVHVPVFHAKELEGCPFAEASGVTFYEAMNLTDEGHVAELYGAVPRLFASIHIAGGFSMGPIDETSLQDWNHLLNLNATSCFLCCRQAARAMKAGEGGRMVNVSARPALVPTGQMAAYAASKAAVAALTTTLAEELAQDGIWVNAVVPSIIDTAANRGAMPDADHTAWPKPAQIAETIVFLASPDNAVTRGALVPVYGRS